MKAVIVTVVLLIVLGVGFWLWTLGVQNDLVTADEQCNQEWGEVQNQLQRKMDLIPNLVGTVKGASEHETELQTGVAELRTQWASAKTSGSIPAQMEAAKGMESFLGRLMVVAEKYPENKANEAFLKLQDELAGTENRIAVARGRYNKDVGTFNKMIKRAPGRWFVEDLGLERKPNFEASEAAQKNDFRVDFSK